MVSDQECMHIITDTLRHQKASIQEGNRYQLEFETGLFPIDGNRNFYFPYKIYDEDLALHTDFIFGEEKRRFNSFKYSLEAAWQGIFMTPIMTGSGHYQPRTRKQITYLTHPRETITHPRVAIIHPQRTYQDVKNDIANQLSSMPDFTARTRITIEGQTVEHTIKTLEPEKGLFGKPLQERIADIQSRNKDPQYGGYCRPRKDVEAEITNRQSSSSGGSASAQPQKPQQQQARHARQVPTCPNCGKNNSPGAKFCNQCGTKL
jgi:hypothetical protein